MALYIGCSRSKKKIKIGSSIIILWQYVKSKILGLEPMNISHVYGRFSGSSWGCDFIYHQQGSGSNFMGGERFLQLHEVEDEFMLPIPKELEIKIGQSCVKREGQTYAYMQNIGIGLVGIVWLLSFTKIVIKNPFTSKTNCLEEWVDLLVEHLGIEKPQHVDSWLPQDFWTWFVNLTFIDENNNEKI